METFDQSHPGEDARPLSDVAERKTLDDSLNLREVVGKFWARKWLIASSVIVCTVLAFAIAKLMTPIYTGEALVVIKPVRAGEPATTASVQAIQGGPETVPTEALVLQSRTLARQTIERLHLERDPEFASRSQADVAPIAAVGGEAGLPGPAALQGQAAPSPAASPVSTAVVDAVMRRLSVAVQPRSNVIQVSFRSSRPTIAALVPNTMVQLYLDRLASEKNQALAQESERLDSVILPMLRQKIFDSEADRTIYERYRARSDDVHSSMGQARPDASLLSAADVPLAPSFPRTTMLATAGAGVGGGIGLLLVVLIDLLRGGLHTTDQVESALGVRCLGSVPMLTPDHAGRLQSPLLQPQDTAFGQAVRGIQLKLRSSIRRTGSRVILITSALPGEGKTWIAVNLAASLAADGFSVAVVDCDLHRPSLHRPLDGVRAPGLTDYFAGAATLAEICHNAGDSGVKYVPVGAATAEGAWRIKPAPLIEVIDRLAEDCAFVILDSAPVLAISETMLLAEAADMTIMIVKWRTTPATVARHALRQLQESRAEVSAVLSVVDVKRAAQHGDPAARVYKRLEGYYLQSPRA